MSRALIVVDMQNDFITGSLAVPFAEDAIQHVNYLIMKAQLTPEIPVFYSMDWHSVNHPSFKLHGGLWPSHCVQGTVGAALHPSVLQYPGGVIALKGHEKEEYSAMGALIISPSWSTTMLLDRLNELQVTAVDICGLAYDFCVKATALEAKEAAFQVTVHRIATASVFPSKDGETTKVLLDAGILVI